MEKRARLENTRFVDEGPNEWLEGQRFGLQVVTPAIVDETSEYQQIQVYDTVAHGRCLVLDGVVQLTEKDEFAYHEMLVHVPMFAHQGEAKDALIIGGGDGGAAREVLRHKSVQKLVQVEIDAKVVQLCQQHLPSVNLGSFEDSRMQLRVEDGLKFVEMYNGTFDVLLVDSSDPSQGPNSPLFSIEFYTHLRRLMKSGSILCIQGENPWFYEALLRDIQKKLKSIFGENVAYYLSQVPTYPGGLIGFFICWVGDFKVQVVQHEKNKEISEGLRYYSAEIHSASFVLPKHLQKIFKREE